MGSEKKRGGRFACAITISIHILKITGPRAVCCGLILIVCSLIALVFQKKSVLSDNIKYINDMRTGFTTTGIQISQITRRI